MPGSSLASLLLEAIQSHQATPNPEGSAWLDALQTPYNNTLAGIGEGGGALNTYGQMNAPVPGFRGRGDTAPIEKPLVKDDGVPNLPPEASFTPIADRRLTTMLGGSQPQPNGRLAQALQQPPQQAPENEFGPALDAVAKNYPRLAPYLPNVVVQRGKSDDDRQLEFYPPWERDNPNPGKITLELYRDMKGDALHSAIAGDLLHHLGGTDPESGTPVDPQFYAMKRAVADSRDPRSVALDQRTHAAAVANEGETRSLKDWLDQSRIDAYIRGYITPDDADEWRKSGIYQGPMLSAVEQIKNYLQAR